MHRSLGRLPKRVLLKANVLLDAAFVTNYFPPPLPTIEDFPPRRHAPRSSVAVERLPGG